MRKLDKTKTFKEGKRIVSFDEKSFEKSATIFYEFD